MFTLTGALCLHGRSPHHQHRRFVADPPQSRKLLIDAIGLPLEGAGFVLLHPARTEPWGQTVARLLTSDGLIVGISYAPVLHDEERA